MFSHYLFLVLTVVFVATNAEVATEVDIATDGDVTRTYQSKFVSKHLYPEAQWEGLGITANVNDYVDNTISMIVPFIQQHGLDPMILPDIEEGFEVRPILVPYSAWLRLLDGYATGFVNIARSGDQQVSYFAKMLRVRIQLEMSDLEIRYKYEVKVMNLGPTGTITASVEHLRIVFDVLIDFNNDEIHLQEFAINDVGRIRVRFGGNILTDWLVNPVINIFLRIIDTVIMNVVESNILSALHAGIAFINSNLKDVIRHLESL